LLFPSIVLMLNRPIKSVVYTDEGMRINPRLEVTPDNMPCCIIHVIHSSIYFSNSNAKVRKVFDITNFFSLKYININIFMNR